MKFSRVIRRYGGKGKFFNLYVPYITKIAMDAGCDTFVDCFGGGGTMSLLASQMTVPGNSNLRMFSRVIYNDLDPGMAAIHRVVKSEKNAVYLSRMALATPHCKEVFDEAYDIYAKANDGLIEVDDMELAYYTFVVNAMSFNCDSKNYNRWGEEHPEIYRKRATDIVNIVPYMERIEVREEQYYSLIHEFGNNPRVMFFLDPPYLAAERAINADEVYKNEFWNIEHIFMNRILAECCSNWILCGYRAKSEGWESRIYGDLEKQPDVSVIDLGAVHKPSSSKSVAGGGSAHEFIWMKYNYRGSDNKMVH